MFGILPDCLTTGRLQKKMEEQPADRTSTPSLCFMTVRGREARYIQNESLAGAA